MSGHFFRLTTEYPVVTVVGLGPEEATINEEEQINEKRENVRAATAAGYNAINALDAKILLAYYRFEELKSKKDSDAEIQISLLYPTEATLKEWQEGHTLAFGQNQLRRLGDLPANMLTPMRFVDEAKKILDGLPVKVIVHDKEWALKKGMGSFLSVAQGSDYPCAFLELHYQGANMPAGSKLIVYVGKGVTFDTGGISIKPAAKMHEMKADMMGAGNVLCGIATMTRLGLRTHVVGLIPLTENTINGKATKPGDVFRAMNGKTIEVQHTDAEGWLVPADALCYADEFEPAAVIDIATLTGVASIAVADFCVIAFCSENQVREKISDASIDSGERFWRFPLFKCYTNCPYQYCDCCAWQS